ncbi:unnamed protein product [Somion occarium]|uniref:F-box domain-containing protein n=1 Tax=Somion occarium TaxID=3059160 RepID=A0ABP1CLE2_9APHY
MQVLQCTETRSSLNPASRRWFFSSVMLIVHMPPELCDYTIDFLHDDMPSLKSCSLTCRSWTPATRFHLFRSVDIHSQHACDGLYRLLRHSPYLGEMVRRLNISSLTVDAVKADKTAVPFSSVLTIVPPSLFGLLPNVKILDVSVLTIDQALCSQFIQNFTSVNELSLHGCFFASLKGFAEFVLSFPLLEALSLHDVRWDSNESNDCRAASNPSKLRSLTLGKGIDVSCLAKWLLLGYLCPGLESISACCSSEQDVIALSGLLKETYALQRCELSWYGFASNDIIDLVPAFSLDACSSLQSVTLRCPVMYSQSLPWVTSLLARLPAESIQAIDIELRLLGGIESIDWDYMGRILSGKSFRRLSSVAINAITWSSVSQSPEELQSFLCSHLSALDCRGILHVSVR